MYAVVVGVDVFSVKLYFLGSLNIIDFTNISRTKPSNTYTSKVLNSTTLFKQLHKITQVRTYRNYNQILNLKNQQYD